MNPDLLLMAYPLWAVPVHLVCNFFITRKLIAHYSTPATMAGALLVNLVVCMPLAMKAQMWVDYLYFPWFLAYAYSPVGPELSQAGLAITVGLTVLGSALWIATAKKRAPGNENADAASAEGGDWHLMPVPVLCAPVQPNLHVC